MTLKARITEDMKDAMRAKDAARLSTIRLLLAAIKQREVDERNELHRRRRARRHRQDGQAAPRLDRAVRGRQAAWTWSRSEQAELAVLQGYLPQQLTDAEIDAAVAAAIAATGAAGPAGMGKVMAELKPQARRPRRHDGRFGARSRRSSPLSRPRAPRVGARRTGATIAALPPARSGCL